MKNSPRWAIAQRTVQTYTHQRGSGGRKNCSVLALSLSREGAGAFNSTTVSFTYCITLGWFTWFMHPLPHPCVLSYHVTSLTSLTQRPRPALNHKDNTIRFPHFVFPTVHLWCVLVFTLASYNSLDCFLLDPIYSDFFFNLIHKVLFLPLHCGRTNTTFNNNGSAHYSIVLPESLLKIDQAHC